MQDRIDGGISLLLRCPGQLQPEVGVENITLDAYITPRELKEGGKEVDEGVALLAQSFGQDFVLPHLRRFAGRCITENVVPPPMPSLLFYNSI